MNIDLLLLVAWIGWGASVSWPMPASGPESRACLFRPNESHLFPDAGSLPIPDRWGCHSDQGDRSAVPFAEVVRESVGRVLVIDSSTAGTDSRYYGQEGKEVAWNSVSNASGYTIEAKLKVGGRISWPESSGKVYFVDASGGDDARDGLSEETAWRSIRKVNRERYAPGDSILFKRGEVWAKELIGSDQRLEVSSSGREGNPILYGAYGEGERPRIDGTGIAVDWPAGGLIAVENQQWIRITGLESANSSFAAFAVLSDSAHIRIDDCELHHCDTSGVLCRGYAGYGHQTDITIANNIIHHTNRTCNQEAISLGGVHTFVIRNNVLYDCSKEVIDPKNEAAHGRIFNNYIYNCGFGWYDQTDSPYPHVFCCIYICSWDQTIRDIHVYNNLMRNNWAVGLAPATEYGGTCENIWFYNNIVDGCYGGFGIEDFTYVTDGPHLKKDIYLINNVFHNSIGDAIKFHQNRTDQLKNIVIRNNIISGGDYHMANFTSDTDQDPYDWKEIHFDHNLLEGHSHYYGTRFVRGTAPAYVDADYGSFNLQSCSPAIDAGSGADGPRYDYDGKRRPAAEGYDLGAYEYGAEYTFVQEIAWGDGSFRCRLLITPDRIIIPGNCIEGPARAYPMDTTDDYHIYSIRVKGPVVSVNVDGEGGFRCRLNRKTAAKIIQWGDISATAGQGGRALWRSLGYQLEGCTIPGATPEPAPLPTPPWRGKGGRDKGRVKALTDTASL